MLLRHDACLQLTYQMCKLFLNSKRMRTSGWKSTKKITIYNDNLLPLNLVAILLYDNHDIKMSS